MGGLQGDVRRRTSPNFVGRTRETSMGDDEDIDWSLATYEGLRRQQHREFRALTLREKIRVLEETADVVRVFAARAAARRTPP